ncbi:YfhE family protein [Bacillus massilinigeriensis]|nr:YfhE family protein [Bacillus mediterraneensis]
MDKKKKEKQRHTLTSMQEVTYSREFKMADKAGGFRAPKRDQ